ncbi:MAG: hypothetical protein CM1200mP30_15400 [Pseudomonadota bacterium]|nr:MAG: hypothetical protein CM1200mP30_15400 [Pseudomonadota bacterium]
MLTKVVYGALDDLGKAWKSLTPLEPFFERIEINPKFTAIVLQRKLWQALHLMLRSIVSLYNEFLSSLCNA